MNEAPALYPSLYTGLLAGSVTLGATWKAVLLDSSYDYDATDTVLADVASSVIDTTTLTSLASLSSADPGQLVCDDPVWSAPPDGLVVKGMVVYVDVGSGILAAYYGRRSDGRAISTTTSGAAFTFTLQASKLLRIGGAT